MPKRNVKATWEEVNELMHDIKDTLTVLVATRGIVVRELNSIQKKLAKQVEDLNKIILAQVNNE